MHGVGVPLPLPHLPRCLPYDTPGYVRARTIIPQTGQLVKRKIEEILNKNKQSWNCYFVQYSIL